MTNERPQDGSTPDAPTAAHFVVEADASDSPAWQQVEAGRYMPRRIRGSCKGRALG